MPDNHKPFRPSNATQGDAFLASFCEKCDKYGEIGSRCEIVVLTHAYDEDDPKYPREWTYDEDGWPTCTAFSEGGERLPELGASDDNQPA